tara:strand:- start:657 stop:776 length:120 start_codon:yes stop_codon:yes gene_type:complete
MEAQRIEAQRIEAQRIEGHNPLLLVADLVLVQSILTYRV